MLSKILSLQKMEAVSPPFEIIQGFMFVSSKRMSDFKG